MIAELPVVGAFIHRATELDESWSEGALPEFLIGLEATCSGAKPAKAIQTSMQAYYEQALRLSGGRRASLFVSYAENACIPAQNRAQFRETLERALRIDPDGHVETRLANLIAQRRARWMLGRIDELFLERPLWRRGGAMKSLAPVDRRGKRHEVNPNLELRRSDMTRAIIALLLLGCLFPASPQMAIKMGTLAPDGSPWHQALKMMGERWRKISGGQVKLVIYPGGVLGDEPDMVNKMRIGQIQAAGLSGAGLSGIYPGVMALQIPMMFDSYDELDYVRELVTARLEKSIEARGYAGRNTIERVNCRLDGKRRFGHFLPNWFASFLLLLRIVSGAILMASLLCTTEGPASYSIPLTSSAPSPVIDQSDALSP